MTEVTRRVRRKTAARLYSRGKSREVILILDPPGTIITFRLAGEKRSVSLSVSVAYGLACRAEAEATRERKKQERKSRKAGRA